MEPPGTGSVRQRDLIHLHVREAVARNGVAQIARGGVGRLVGPDPALGPYGLGHGERVGAAVRADVDCARAGPQHPAHERDLLFEPILLLDQRVGGDRRRGRNANLAAALHADV